MIGSRTRRLFGIAATASLALAALGVGPASAATPGWEYINVQQLPATVAPGANAGFRFTIHNKGTSNISQLFLTDSVNAEPTYFSNTRGTACTLSPNLFCSFGALAPNASITVTVAYRVGTSAFTNTFKLDSTGDPSGKNNSHGDSLPLAFTTAVSGSVDFDGGFVIPQGDGSYATTGSLGRNNKQTSQVDVHEALVPVTVQDGPVSSACLAIECANFIGEWTRLTVPGNEALIKVTLNIWGGSVSGGVAPGDIFILHTNDAGTATDVIDTPCSPATGAPTNPECLTVTKVGSNYRIVVWLAHNGTIRGGF